MLPLEGIKVIELAQTFAGPFRAEILAHLGADVIKAEKPNGGDDARLGQVDATGRRIRVLPRSV
jgi:crotonobetainyl-CoA:carnitine CoA-transferase CaiB-like acyl-CoA transferase